MTREEKRQARIDRYNELAAKAQKESSVVFGHADKMAEVIPFGQPIHGAADRRYREKIGAKMDKGVDLCHKAEYYAKKAESVENNNAIYLEDENAVEKLTQKIEELEKTQETMKAVNKIIKSKKFADIDKIEQIQALGVSETSATKLVNMPDCFGNFGFASFSLTNNNANIRRFKERLEQAIRLKNTQSKEYTINDVKVVENTEENRLQLFFDGKPADEVRGNLKHNGFRWSPSNGCWQSYLNRYQIGRAKQLIENI